MRVVPFMMPSTRIIPSPTTLFTVFETPQTTSTPAHSLSSTERSRLIGRRFFGSLGWMTSAFGQKRTAYFDQSDRAIFCRTALE